MPFVTHIAIVARAPNVADDGGPVADGPGADCPQASAAASPPLDPIGRASEILGDGWETPVASRRRPPGESRGRLRHVGYGATWQTSAAPAPDSTPSTGAPLGGRGASDSIDAWMATHPRRTQAIGLGCMLAAVALGTQVGCVLEPVGPLCGSRLVSAGAVSVLALAIGLGLVVLTTPGAPAREVELESGPQPAGANTPMG